MKYKHVPWPLGVRDNYALIYSELMRIEAMLETCLAEDEIDNPFLYEILLPKVMKRIGWIHNMAQMMLWYAPKGQGSPPKWLDIVKEIIHICQPDNPDSIYAKLDSPKLKQQIRSQRFPEVAKLVKGILATIRYMRKLLESLPLEHSSIRITQSGFVEVVLK